MFDCLFVVSIVRTIIEAFKESSEPVIPAENWANKELMHQDRIINHLSENEIMKNVQNGKYKLTSTYPEPHRDSNGRIIIENSRLYHEDLIKYGAVQVGKWIEQGRYNL